MDEKQWLEELVQNGDFTVSMSAKHELAVLALIKDHYKIELENKALRGALDDIETRAQEGMNVNYDDEYYEMVKSGWEHQHPGESFGDRMGGE